MESVQKKYAIVHMLWSNIVYFHLSSLRTEIFLHNLLFSTMLNTIPASSHGVDPQFFFYFTVEIYVFPNEFGSHFAQVLQNAHV